MEIWFQSFLEAFGYMMLIAYSLVVLSGLVICTINLIQSKHALSRIIGWTLTGIVGFSGLFATIKAIS